MFQVVSNPNFGEELTLEQINEITGYRSPDFNARFGEELTLDEIDKILRSTQSRQEYKDWFGARKDQFKRDILGRYGFTRIDGVAFKITWVTPTTFFIQQNEGWVPCAYLSLAIYEELPTAEWE